MNADKKVTVTFIMQLLATSACFIIMINSFDSKSVFRITASTTGFVIFFTLACMVGYRLFKKS